MKKFLEMILERASEFINYKKDTQKKKLLSTVIPFFNGLSINSNFLKFYIISMKYFIVIHPMYRAIVTFHQELLQPL